MFWLRDFCSFSEGILMSRKFKFWFGRWIIVLWSLWDVVNILVLFYNWFCKILRFFSWLFFSGVVVEVFFIVVFDWFVCVLRFFVGDLVLVGIVFNVVVCDDNLLLEGFWGFVL